MILRKNGQQRITIILINMILQSAFPEHLFVPKRLLIFFLRIAIIRYADNHQIIEDLTRDSKVTLDTLGWKKIEISADLHRIYLNDSLVQVDKWAENRLAVSGQRAYQAGINISNLKNGIHETRIEKLLLIYGFFDDQLEIRLREDWSAFTFINK